MSTKSYLVTTALPYANGPLHLGHILENIWADMWVRHLRQQQNEVYFFAPMTLMGRPSCWKLKNGEFHPKL